MNQLDNSVVRLQLSTYNAEEFVKSAKYATTMTIASSPDDSDYALVIDNCTYMTINATLIYLQERGCVIPADVLAVFNIQG